MNDSEKYRRLSNSLPDFAREMNFIPTRQQAQVLADVSNGTFSLGSSREDKARRRIAVKSGQGVGKTSLSVVAGLWRVFRMPDSKAFVTAPTMRQCLSVWHAEAKLRLECASPWIRQRMKLTGTKIIFCDRPKLWELAYFTATKPENAQGLHNDHLTVICEEASGISRPLMEQIDGTLKNRDFLWFLIGNPNSRTSYFYDVFTRERARWTTRTLNARLSPMVDQDTVREQIEQYGADSDFVRVRIEGEFPKVEPDRLIDIESLERAAARDVYDYSLENPRPYPAGAPQVQFGMDFARFGGDENVFVVRVGGSEFHREVMRGVDPHVLIGSAFDFQRQMGWKDEDVLFVIDASGMGQGLVYDFQRAGKRVFEFHNNGTGADGFSNKITEAYWGLRELLRNNLIRVQDDAETFMQLTSRKYWFDKSGQFILEEKKDFKKREGVSPDRADATALAFYTGGVVQSQITGGGAAARTKRVRYTTPGERRIS